MSTTLFGHGLAAPLLISSMTGGTERARSINYNLAIAAERAGVALALGSQRAALEDPSLLADVSRSRRRAARRALRKYRRGTIQLRRDGRRRHSRRPRHRGGWFVPPPQSTSRGGYSRAAIRIFATSCPGSPNSARRVGVPVIAKSVGSGISVRTATRLYDAGVAAIDVAGAGGTSWARVEGRRAGDAKREALAESFAAWGYPTADATANLRRAFPEAIIFASGGIRTGRGRSQGDRPRRERRGCRSALSRARDALGGRRVRRPRRDRERPAHRDLRERLPTPDGPTRGRLCARLHGDVDRRTFDLNLECIDRREADGHAAVPDVEAPSVPGDTSPRSLRPTPRRADHPDEDSRFRSRETFRRR